MLRVALASLVLPLTLLAGCTCNSGNGCPAEYTIGDQCKVEGQVCPYPGTRCNTTCTCKNEVGGFRWNCDVTMCACTCPCGKIAISTCETLQCAKAADPCPSTEEAQTLCARIVCIDAGTPDARPDSRSRDGRGDLRKDAVRDVGKDAPVHAPEMRVDGPLDLGGGSP